MVSTSDLPIDVTRIMDRASQKDVHVFIFNDCLLITRSTSRKQAFQFKEQLFFADTVVKELAEACLCFFPVLVMP